jgi:hypothetical protein
MAGSKSNYFENAILKHIFGDTTYSVPATLYVGLWDNTVTLGETSTGASVGEVDTSGTGYGRVAVLNDNTKWTVTDNVSENAADITFETALADWGTINQFAILDATTGGNILFWSTLAVAKTVTTGDTVRFNAGDITVTEN